MDNIESYVEYLLADFPETRESDDILYMKMLERDGRFNFENISVVSFFKNRTKTDIPSLETVGRARRRVQENRPDLRGSKQIQRARRKREKQFKEYYGGNDGK